MSERDRLPNRRPNRTFDLVCDHLVYTASFGLTASGAIAEVFLSQKKPASPADAVARDAAIAASLALQYGCPLDVLRDALGFDDQGEPLTPLGIALSKDWL